MTPAKRVENILYKMASYADVVKFEEETPPHTIRLIKSGEFYRAYDHSAWLFQCCIAEHKVMRKYVKPLKRDVFYVGFPAKSLFNNIGERRSTKTDYGFDIELMEGEIPDDTGFETWKSAIVAEPSSKGDFNSLPMAGGDAEREVIRRLRDSPLESMSLVDCAVFLSELRKLLNNR